MEEEIDIFDINLNKLDDTFEYVEILTSYNNVVDIYNSDFCNTNKVHRFSIIMKFISTMSKRVNNHNLVEISYNTFREYFDNDKVLKQFKELLSNLGIFKLMFVAGNKVVDGKLKNHPDIYEFNIDGFCIVNVKSKAYDKPDNKGYDRAKKLYNHDKVSLCIDENKIKQLLESKLNSKGEQYKDKEIEYATEIVKKIKENGLTAKWTKRKGRYSNDITLLPAPITDFITIDGQKTVTIDQHATYFWFLPELLKRTMTRFDVGSYSRQFISPIANESYQKLCEDLNKIQLDKGSVYSKLGLVCDISIEEAKKNILSALCDRLKCPKGDRGNMLAELFKEYPGLELAFNTLKNGTSEIATRLMCYEAEYFKKYSKKLKENGVDCVIKYDSVIVKEEFEDITKKIGETVFQELFGYKAILKSKSTISKKEFEEYKEVVSSSKDSEASLNKDLKLPRLSGANSKLGQYNIKGEEEGEGTPITPNLEKIGCNRGSLLSHVGSLKKTTIINKGKGYRCAFTKNGKRVDILSKTRKNETKKQFKDRIKLEYGLTDEDFREDEIAKNEQAVGNQEQTINKDQMIKEPETLNDMPETKSTVLEASSDIVEPNSNDDEDDFVARMVKQFGVTYPIKN